MSGHISGILLLQCTMTRLTLLASEIFYLVRSITYCAFLVNVTQLLNCHSLEHIAEVFMVVSYGTYLTRPLMLFVLFGARDSGASGTFHIILTVNYWFLESDCDVVDFVTRHGVYFRRMLSPIGRNSLFCCRRFGVRLSDIAPINKSFVWAHYQSQLTELLRRAVLVPLELLFC